MRDEKQQVSGVSKLPPGSLPLQHNTYTVSTNGQEIVSYLGDWAIYGRAWDFSRTPVKNLNRLVYGFAGICFPGAHSIQASLRSERVRELLRPRVWALASIRAALLA